MVENFSFKAIIYKIEIRIKENNLAIFGNYVAGISLRDMITAAKTFSRHPTEYSQL